MTFKTRGSVPASVLAVLAAPLIYANLAAFAHADATIQAHLDRQQELLAANQATLAGADAEKRELTTDEKNTITANSAEFDKLGQEIEIRERVIAQNTLLNEPRPRITQPDAVGDDPGEVEPPAPPQNRIAPPAPPRRPSARVEPVVRTTMNNGGFRSFGDFALAVYHASGEGAQPDQRLLIPRGAAAGTISTEGSGPDGGYAVPADFRASIMAMVFSEDSLLGRCDVQQTSGNSFSAPIDETTPWGTTGVQAYWEKEAKAITQSKLHLGSVAVRMHKLAALVPISEEMLEDAPQVDGYLRSKTPEAMDFAISMGLTWGTGAGEPLGFMNSPALVTVAAEGSQTADTINATNCVKMLARLPTRSRPSAVWLIHPDAEPQLPVMLLGTQPVYMPPGGMAAQPFGNLLGRPVIPHQVCDTVGNLGDIMLVDWGQYLAIRKAAGLQINTSIHLWFDQDLTAFKFTMRLGGQPWWAGPLSNRAGSSNQSPFVTLAAR